MKRPSFILRCTAFLFILVFLQKSGAGLFFHNLFHKSATASEIPDRQHDKSKGLNFTCTCIDDFLVPFDDAEETLYSSPITNRIVAETFFENRIPFNTSIASYLRGPPAGKA